MSLFRQIRRILTALTLVLVLTVTAGCGGVSTARQPANPPAIGSGSYAQLERGNTSVGQDFGNWVVQAAKGLIQDAYVRDSNKLGVVISPQVRPNDVKPLARSLAEGFHRNFPDRNLTVLVYAPDKQLILTAKYNEQSKQIEYSGAGVG